MNKRILPLVALLFAGSIFITSCKDKDKTDTPAPTNTAPALLSGAQTGQAFSTGTVNDFTLAANEGNVVLLVANNTTGKIYAIDLKDNDASKAAANTITSTITDFRDKIAAKMGIVSTAVRFANMEVNPISKAVYVQARSAQNNDYKIFKITNGGNTVDMIDFENVTYSELTFSTGGHTIFDMTWGDNTLYISYAHAATLNGQVASAPAPFAHNTSVTSRATTVFKTNWGGNFFTDAPLETMTYGEVDGEKRLMGVTVCAPGFSFKTDDINSGTGLLEVKEYFNLNTMQPVKVFCVTQADKTYLIELHSNGRITRVGEKYINGSQTKVNAQAAYILSNNGTQVAAGLTDEDVKLLAPANSEQIMICKYSDTKLFVVKNTGALTILDI